MGKARLWPAALVVAVGLLWMGRIWLVGEAIRQDRITRTGATLIVCTALLVLWFVFASRLRWKVRLAGLGLLVALLTGFVGAFRIEGVSGDLMPILAFRWSARPGTPPAMPASPVAVVAAPTVAPETSASVAPAAAPSTIAARAPSPGPTASSPARTDAPQAASDYPQFLGPSRDGVLPGPRLFRDWTARPPRLLWRQPVGAGWSAFAVRGDVAVTQEQHGDEEQVVAYDAATGKVLWRHAEKARYDTVIAGLGPRATPTVERDRVFVMGATGVLSALRLDTGARLWSHQVLQENGSENPSWGTSGSPLVTGELVVVSAGGSNGRSLIAYRADTGEQAWAGGHDKQSYSSPTLATLGGRRQVLVFNQASVAGHDPDTGALLWEHAFPRDQPNVAQPLPLSESEVMVSAGYGVGSKLYKVEAGKDGAFGVRLLWESPRLKAKFANLVSRDGYVYGLDDGVFVCLDPRDGQRKWRDGRYGHGQMILVGGLLLLQAESGEVVLIEPSPDGLRELTRFAAFDAKTWNPPALAGRRLFVRNDREAAAFELPIAE